MYNMECVLMNPLVKDMVKYVQGLEKVTKFGVVVISSFPSTVCYIFKNLRKVHH